MKFIKDGLNSVVVYGCGLIIVNGLSFLMLPFYTRHFIPAEYAFITLLLTCLPFTRYSLPLEICQAAPVLSADHPEKIQTYVSIGFWFTLGINLLCYCMFYIVNNWFHFVNLSSYHLLILFSLLLIDCLFYYSSNILRWQLKHFKYNIIISSVAILEVALVFLFILGFKLTIIGVFYAWLISRALGFLTVYLLNRDFYALIFNVYDFKKMLGFSFPLVLSNIPYNLNRAIDRWIIASFLGLSALGIYGAGSVIGGMINFVMASFASSLTPYIYRNHHKKEAPVEIVKLFYIVLMFCIVLALFFALFNKEILYILVAKEYYQILSSQPIVPLFILAAIFSGLFTFFPGLSIKRKTTYVIWFNLISLLANVVLALTLIHVLSLLGVALAMAMSMFINSFLYMIFSNKWYPLAFKFKHVISLISLLFLGYIIGIYLGMKYNVFEMDHMITRGLYFLIFIAICIKLLWKTFRDLSVNYSDELIPSYSNIKG